VSSDFQTTIDAIITDLRANVAAIGAIPTGNIHRYEPWDPQDLLASPGDGNHLAVWPAVEGAEGARPLTTGPGSDEIEQRFAVSYWEYIGVEGGAGVRDEAATAALLTLHNAVRARFYIIANIQLGGAHMTRYLGTSFPQRASGVRWFTLTIASFRHIHAV
jgi:hypothetical protein